MKLLFIHQNYPGQFVHLAPELARRGHDVRALTLRFPEPRNIDGVQVIPYQILHKPGQGLHPWVQDSESKVLRGLSCAQAASQMGWEPDAIIGHYGWGETMFLKHVFPHARMGLYCELYYDPDHPAVHSDMEQMTPQQQLNHRLKMRLRNVNTRLHEDIMDAGICPTLFQAASFPERLRDRITVQHDGIDTDKAAPDHAAQFTLPNGRVLTRDDEVITFVARALEPMRGFDILMHALPDILRARPKAQVLIVGRDEVSYGAQAPGGGGWKDHYLTEISPRLGPRALDRMHFLGNIPHDQFCTMLQISRVHLYLTRPFVLSWSMIEAMATGCAIVASDGPSVRDAAGPDEARLVQLDPTAVKSAVVELLNDPSERVRLGENARARAMDFDLRENCLPKLVEWAEALEYMPSRQPQD